MKLGTWSWWPHLLDYKTFKPWGELLITKRSFYHMKATYNCASRLPEDETAHLFWPDWWCQTRKAEMAVLAYADNKMLNCPQEMLDCTQEFAVWTGLQFKESKCSINNHSLRHFVEIISTSTVRNYQLKTTTQILTMSTQCRHQDWGKEHKGTIHYIPYHMVIFDI